MEHIICKTENSWFIQTEFYGQKEHRHFGGHIMIGLSGPFCACVEKEQLGIRGLIIGSNVNHNISESQMVLVIFVDELTPFASRIKDGLLRGKPYYCLSDTIIEVIRETWLSAKCVNDIHLIACKIEEIIEEASHIVSPKMDDLRILKLADWMRKATNLQEMTLQDVACFIHLSPSYLSHIFQKRNGLTWKRFLANLKLERATWLVLQGENLTDACMEAGFSSSSHFADISREIYGIPLSQILDMTVIT